MFKTIEEIYPGSRLSQVTSFKCPCCGHKDEYYVWPQEVCEGCGFHLERMLCMSEDLADRVEHYREGEL